MYTTGDLAAACNLPETECRTTLEFGSVDPAPVSGELRFYTRFGYDYVSPEGSMEGAIQVTAGEPTGVVYMALHDPTRGTGGSASRQ